MIAQIDYIRAFGIFRDFKWNATLPEFSRINLFYGWNYSGKTTLSRVFRSIEEKAHPREYPHGRFSATRSDGSRVESHNMTTAPRVRVFNRDYVQKNFAEEHTAPAVFIVGEENVTLRNRLELLSRRGDRILRISNDFQEQKRAAQNRLDTAKTDKARDIGNLLGIRNFRSPDLERRLAEVQSAPDDFVLADEVVEARLQTARGSEQYSAIAPLQVALPDLGRLAIEVNEHLGQTATNKAIARLKGVVGLEEWVREGLEFHASSTSCEFCGNTLAEARLAELRGHFSEAYENLVAGIRAQLAALPSFIPSPLSLDERDLLPNQRARFAHAKAMFSGWLEWLLGVQEELSEALREKQSAVEKLMKWEGDLARANEGGQILAEVNTLIEEHNSAVAQMDATKARAREDLERHYSAQFLKEGALSRSEAEVVRASKTILRATRLRERNDGEVRAVEARIKHSSIGAASLNGLVRYLLSDSDIAVVPVGDVSFRFERAGQPAIHLSEGEKTALTFAYFVTSLGAAGTSIDQSIVFVDDPVSSLDSNHIYAVFALIVERLTQARQLFVSTHNSELFNLLKSRWFDRHKNGKETRAYYLLRSVDCAGDPVAEIQDLPWLLRAFKSEYEFVFSELRSFIEDPSPSVRAAYLSSSLLRKFLEAYLGFRRPHIRKWSDKLDLILSTPEERREVQKFADDAMHLQALGRALEHPDQICATAKRCVQAVWDGLRKNDPEHFGSLAAATAAPQP